MSVYQPGIPTGTVNLDVDYLNIQNNFQQLDTSFGVDHLPFSNQTAQNGYHKSIHFNPVSTTATNPPNNYVPGTASPVGVPAATPGFGQLFSAQVNDGVNADEALFWLSGGNRLIELTRNFAPKISARGYTNLPGGLIIQWGRTALGGFQGQAGTVLFTTGGGINFPNNCFLVMVSLICPAGGTGSSDNTMCVRDSVSASQFVFQYNGSGSYVGFYWVAIGN